MLFDVTAAVRLPAVFGFFENVTVSDVGDALVTAPTAPLFRTTVLLVATASKPKPLIITVFAVGAISSVLLVTTCAIEAT